MEVIHRRSSKFFSRSSASETTPVGLAVPLTSTPKTTVDENGRKSRVNMIRDRQSWTFWWASWIGCIREDVETRVMGEERTHVLHGRSRSRDHANSWARLVNRYARSPSGFAPFNSRELREDRLERPDLNSVRRMRFSWNVSRIS